VYVLCQRSAVCLSNHVLKLSRFSVQKPSDWVVMITITSWYEHKWLICPCHGHCLCQSGTQERRTEKEEISLPSHFKEWLTRSEDDPKKVNGPRSEPTDHGRLMQHHFKLESSSVVLTTNTFGDFSKCCIISRLVNQEDLYIIGEESRKLWLRFVHQPQTARCLAFYFVLGKLCQTIAKEYQDANKVVSSTLKFVVSDLGHGY
jgi:hypothetical protein